jgi:hypothetical protein
MPYIAALSFILGKFQLAEMRLLIISLVSTFVFVGIRYLLLPNLAILGKIAKNEKLQQSAFIIE